VSGALKTNFWEENVVKKFLWSCLAVVLTFAPTVARAQTEEEIRNKIMQDLKPWIEQEVQRRVKEAMEAAKTNALPTATQPPSANVPGYGQAPSGGWTPSQPIPLIRAGSAYMNISFDTLFDAGWSTDSNPDQNIQLGDHDPQTRGFSLRNAEIALDGAVDPYFKAFANIVLKLDNNGETAIELEEAFAQTTALPWNLQVKAGQFFVPFGRQNQQHPHAWDFVDQPLIMNRMFGGDGLRSVGTVLSWLAPTPFYTELQLSILNGEGGATSSFRNEGEDDGTGTNRLFGRATINRRFRNPGELLYVPRVITSFNLTDEQTLVLGASAAFGPNDTGANTDTQIYGVDTYWKWRPANAQQGFPFVSWQTEAMFRRYEAGEDLTVPLPAETLEDYGFYSQILYGFRLGWVAGLRGEFVTGDNRANDVNDPLARADRTRISPNLTFYPSEFSKIRLQYNYDHGQAFGDEHSVWMQLEFLLGAHAAHKF
jgi:hypothetical protein